MKIIVMSDSHGNMINAEIVLDTVKNVDAVAFLGDHAYDAESLQKKYKMDFHIVRGNCDFGSPYPDVDYIFANDKKILITHGHKLNVKYSMEGLSYYAEEKGAHVALFGHTHMPYANWVGPVFLMNPGSISLPRTSRYPTYGILDIEAGAMTASVVVMNKKGVFQIMKQVQVF